MADKLFEHWEILLSIIGAIILWYKDWIAIRLGIKKQTVTLETNTIENLQRNLDIYQEMVTDLSERYQRKVEEIEEAFKESVERLKAEVEELKTINDKLKIYIEKQNKRLKYYEDKYGASEK